MLWQMWATVVIVIDSKVYVVFQVAFGITHRELVDRFTKIYYIQSGNVD